MSKTPEEIADECMAKAVKAGFRPKAKNDASSHVGARAGAELIAQCAADVTPQPVEWLWPGRVALSKLTLIAGEAGLGKSQLSIAMAAAVTTGGEWPCGEGRAPEGNVIILSSEDSAEDTVVPRLMAAGADRERVELASTVRDEQSRRSFDLAG